MAVFRVNKNADYTVISNHHLKNKNLSLKAKGLLSVMLSLPDDWDYSINGLVSISLESESAIKSALNELKKFGYLKVTKLSPNKTSSGRYEYIYDVYEKPSETRGEKQGGENQPLEIQGVENHVLYKDTNKSSTNLLNTNNKENIEKVENNSNLVKHTYGDYSNVLLSDEDMEKLRAEFPDYQDRIQNLSEYMASTGKSYKSHLATIRAWARKDKQKPQYQQRQAYSAPPKSSKDQLYDMMSDYYANEGNKPHNDDEVPFPELLNENFGDKPKES